MNPLSKATNGTVYYWYVETRNLQGRKFERLLIWLHNHDIRTFFSIWVHSCKMRYQNAIRTYRVIEHLKHVSVYDFMCVEQCQCIFLRLKQLHFPCKYVCVLLYRYSCMKHTLIVEKYWLCKAHRLSERNSQRETENIGNVAAHLILVCAATTTINGTTP